MNFAVFVHLGLLETVFLQFQQLQQSRSSSLFQSRGSRVWLTSNSQLSMNVSLNKSLCVSPVTMVCPEYVSLPQCQLGSGSRPLQPFKKGVLKLLTQKVHI